MSNNIFDLIRYLLVIIIDKFYKFLEFLFMQVIREREAF